MNILLIGVGAHARRIYYSIIKNEELFLGAKIVAGVDLYGRKKNIEDFLKSKNETLPMIYTHNEEYSKQLDWKTKLQLNEVVRRCKVDGVIISTDPTSHLKYALWALDNNLHILMDKPLTIVSNASTQEKSAKAILEDYQMLKRKYMTVKQSKKLYFGVVTQRRYHPIFIKAKELIKEIFEQTNCPITSIQSFHSDGQWRLPSEIVDIPYHSFNDGYGKVAHSGYHFLDISLWLMEATQSKKKRINNLEILTMPSRPVDFITQLNLKDYEKIFPQFSQTNCYKEEVFIKKTKAYGEIDAFSSLLFKHNDKVVTLGSINLLHNGFSQRGWLMAKSDLYKGNGRVRHESHYISQGPFQAISITSYQSQEINRRNDAKYEIGGEYHLELNIFRNNNFNPKWEPHRTIRLNAPERDALKGYSRGHQEEARRNAIVEFVDFVNGKSSLEASNILSHEGGVRLLSGIYSSMARRYTKKNPVVRIRL